MIFIRVIAPLARWEQNVGGNYVLVYELSPYSAIYQLVQNIAGYDTKDESIENNPHCSIAIGMFSTPIINKKTIHAHKFKQSGPGQSSRYQETGICNKEIIPAHIEYLLNIDIIIGIRNNRKFEREISNSVECQVSNNLLNGNPRYDRPFLGNRQYGIDYLTKYSFRLQKRQVPIQWCFRLSTPELNQHSIQELYLPVYVDWDHSEKSITKLFGVTKPTEGLPPEYVWLDMPFIKKKREK